MTTQTDVKSATVSASGFLNAGGANPSLGVRVKDIYWSGTTAGTLTFADGSSTGTTRITLAVPAAAVNIAIPGEGVRFNNDVYVTFTTAVGSTTVFYG
jgi:hypothetical protein